MGENPPSEEGYDDQKSKSIISMILYWTSDNLLELTEKCPDLEHGFQDAWVADELIKNVVVNA